MFSEKILNTSIAKDFKPELPNLPTTAEERLRSAREEVTATGRRHRAILQRTLEPYIAFGDIPEQSFNIPNSSIVINQDGTLYEEHPVSDGEVNRTEVPDSNYPQLVGKVYDTLANLVSDPTFDKLLETSVGWANEEKLVVKLRSQESLREGIGELIDMGAVADQMAWSEDGDLPQVKESRFLVIEQDYMEFGFSMPGLVLLQSGELVRADRVNGIYDLANATPLRPENYPDVVEDVFRVIFRHDQAAHVRAAVSTGEYKKLIESLLDKERSGISTVISLFEDTNQLRRIGWDEKDSENPNYSESGKPLNLETAIINTDLIRSGMYEFSDQYKLAVLMAQRVFSVGLRRGEVNLQVKPFSGSNSGERYLFKLFLTEEAGGSSKSSSVQFTERGRAVSAVGTSGQEADPSTQMRIILNVIESLKQEGD